jgi:hypothetical protein
LKVEAAIRPLIAAAAHAEGDAKAKLLAIVKATREAEAGSELETNRSAIIQATDQAKDQIELLQKELTLVAATNRERAVSLVQFKALKELDDKHIDPNSAAGKAFIGKKTGEAGAAADLSDAQYVFETERSQRNQLALVQAETGALWLTDAARQDILTKLRIEEDLKKQGISATSAEGQAILANAQKIDQQTRAYQQQKVEVDELKSSADQIVDTIGRALEPENWRHWQDVGKEVLADIEKEFLKLALIDPLKNLINGNNNLPTLFGSGQGQGGSAASSGSSGLAGLIGSLFKGAGSSGGASAGGDVSSLFDFAEYADGTPSAPGGWSWVGEQGPELMNLTPGTAIMPADKSVEMLNARANATPRVIQQSFHYDNRGAVMTEALFSQMHQIAASHATSAANGAIKIAHDNAPGWNSRAAAEKG